jgi:hypothetical protein
MKKSLIVIAFASLLSMSAFAESGSLTCQVFAGAIPMVAHGTLLNIDESSKGSASEINGQLDQPNFGNSIISDVEVNKFTLGVYGNNIGSGLHAHTHAEVKISRADGGDTVKFKFDEKRDANETQEKIVGLKDGSFAIISARYICK